MMWLFSFLAFGLAVAIVLRWIYVDAVKYYRDKEDNDASR